jgi:hypothetical protein
MNKKFLSCKFFSIFGHQNHPGSASVFSENAISGLRMIRKTVQNVKELDHWNVGSGTVPFFLGLVLGAVQQAKKLRNLDFNGFMTS